MGEIVELPALLRTAALRRAMARLDDGTRALRQQRDALAQQTESLGAVRAALRAEAARTDEIVALAEPDVAAAAVHAARGRLGLAQDGGEASGGAAAELAAGRDADRLQGAAHRARVDRVLHHAVADPQLARPGGAVAQHHHLVLH